MAERPRATVVIPTHQRRESLRRALECLEWQTFPCESFEVVVSVDGSTDGTAEMLQALDTPYELHQVLGRGRGRAAACNAAIERARGEVLVILDDDMEPAPQLVERHLSHHAPLSSLCVLGAVPIVLDDSSPRAAGYAKRKFDEHLENLAEPGHEFVPRDFYSGNASLRAETMRRVGGFSESFTAYGNEDVDLSLRLVEAGVELRYDGQALARQTYEKSLRPLALDTIAKGRTTVMLARAHPGAFSKLRLANPWDGSRPWLAARSTLLWGSRRTAAFAGLAVWIATGLERLGLWRAPLFYRAALDYAFWAGVDAELRESTPEGELEQLARELRRGPIDLLLHR
jgi:GT2 family glycosyltransferase